MADIYRIFSEYIKDNNIIEENDQIIVGLSGGADSMCLLLLLEKLSSEMPIKLLAVHVNHQIRGLEADADEQFVKEFCEKRNIQCIGVHAAVRKYAFENGLSLEEAGRTARYQTFYQVAKKLSKADEVSPHIKTAVAHHRDDNAETILLNLIRGTGLKGLQGMQPVAERFGMTIVRPMLCLGRSDIEAYLKEKNIKFRTDSTNLEDEFARNKFRLNIIPQLNRINNKAAVHINEAARSIVQAQEFIEEEARKACSLLVDKRHDGIYIDLDRFGSLNVVVKSQVIRNIIEEIAGSLKDVGKVHVDSVLGLEGKQTGRKVELPYGIMAVRSYSNIIFRKVTDDDIMAHNMTHYARGKRNAAAENAARPQEQSPKADEAFSIDPTHLTTEPSRYQLWDGMEIELQLVQVNPVTRQLLITKNDYTKAFDCAKIKGNLILRRVEPQDEIQFFGGKKSIKKYFVDEKVPQEERKRAIVLTDESQVMWILGYRMSEHYKISELTSLAVQITVTGQPLPAVTQ